MFTIGIRDGLKIRPLLKIMLFTKKYHNLGHNLSKGNYGTFKTTFRKKEIPYARVNKLLLGTAVE